MPDPKKIKSAKDLPNEEIAASREGYAELEAKIKSMGSTEIKKKKVEANPEFSAKVMAEYKAKRKSTVVGTYPFSGTPEQKFWYVYGRAKEFGDPHPEVVAAQHAYESANGTSNIAKEYNNLFGQTDVGDKAGARKWKKYDSVDESIKARATGKWAKNEGYRTAKDPITAMAQIQPSYAPTADGNPTYMQGMGVMLGQYGFFKGDAKKLPNADTNPEFYGEGRGMNPEKKYSYKEEVINANWKSYNEEMAVIKASGEPEDYITTQLTNLQLKYQKMGFMEPFNWKINQENKKKREEVISKGKKKLAEVQVISDFLEDEDLLSATGPNYFDEKEITIMLPATGEGKKKMDALFKAAPNYKQYFVHKKGTARTPNLQLDGKERLVDNHFLLKIPRTDDGKNILSQLEKDVKTIPGNEAFSIFENGKLLADDLNPLGKTGVLRTGPFTNDRLEIKDFLKPDFTPALTAQLRPELAYIEEPEDEEELVPELADPDLSTADPSAYTEEDHRKVAEHQKAVAERKKKQEEKERLETTNTYFGDEQEMPDVYQDEKFKNPFPYAEVLGGVAGVVTGAAMANKKTPKRNEQVSDAYRSYVAELAKLSRIGLPPEEEAYAKRMLSESYQTSIDNLEQNSNGNRNIILGNLGAVDAQKQKGMLDIAARDSMAKTEALHKYGEAVKYISEFDANRDVANNEREYEQALMTKQAGGQLMGAAFASILENIDDHNDNKPGSVNHMIKTRFYRENFGVDPNLVDDGTGRTKYTASWKKKQDQEAFERVAKYNGTREKYWALSPEKRELVSQFQNSNYDADNVFGIIDYLAENDPKGKMDLSKTGDALAKGDFGFLFGEQKTDQDVAAIQNITNNQVAQQKSWTPTADGIPDFLRSESPGPQQQTGASEASKVPAEQSTQKPSMFEEILTGAGNIAKQLATNL